MEMQSTNAKALDSEILSEAQMTLDGDLQGDLGVGEEMTVHF